MLWRDFVAPQQNWDFINQQIPYGLSNAEKRYRLVEAEQDCLPNHSSLKKQHPCYLPMAILETLQADYRNFPKNQTYSIYDPKVYFKDPLTEFRGCDRYQAMIQFIQTWFLDAHLELHDIQRTGDRIRTDWSLSWTTPLPWKPRIQISGWTDLTLQQDATGNEKIVSHIDYWHCSKWQVLKQHFLPNLLPKPKV